MVLAGSSTHPRLYGSPPGPGMQLPCTHSVPVGHVVKKHGSITTGLHCPLKHNVPGGHSSVKHLVLHDDLGWHPSAESSTNPDGHLHPMTHTSGQGCGMGRVSHVRGHALAHGDQVPPDSSQMDCSEGLGTGTVGLKTCRGRLPHRHDRLVMLQLSFSSSSVKIMRVITLNPGMR